jgi:hypothetical protein
MYFFDIADYYSTGNISKTDWLNYGIVGTMLGCAGGPIPDDWGNYITTANATSDAFLKAVNQWYLSSSAMGYTEPMDDGCSPSYADLYNDFNNNYVNFYVKRQELFGTIPLHKYYYDWKVSVNAPGSLFPDMLGGTYESYKQFYLNTGDYFTGTDTGSVTIYNPYTESVSAVTVTYNYGTSFDVSDLQTKVDDFETSMKDMMCSLKNMWSVMDGDTFDELVVDDNGNFLPNSGYTYNMI